MAIEIKRTPTLNGNASQAFIHSINSNYHVTKVSTEQVRNAIQVSKQIMNAFKSKVK